MMRGVTSGVVMSILIRR